MNKFTMRQSWKNQKSETQKSKKSNENVIKITQKLIKKHWKTERIHLKHKTRKSIIKLQEMAHF
jgi:hypothetical protein